MGPNAKAYVLLLAVLVMQIGSSCQEWSNDIAKANNSGVNSTLNSAVNSTLNSTLNPDSTLHVRQEPVQPLGFVSSRSCGVSPKVDASRLTNVSPGQYPWNAVILVDNVFQCMGSLISESIVLTTVSCVLNYKKNDLALKIILGAWAFPPNPSNPQPWLTTYSKAAVLHPLYKEGDKDIKHNVALIRLWDDVPFDHYPYIFPICIIPSTDVDYSSSSQCKVQGWPELQNVDVSRARSFLSGGDVQRSTTGCNPGYACITGSACVANEGSAVVCPGSSLRYYQWGIVASQPKCPIGSSTTISTVSIADNYDFINHYLYPSPS